MKQTTKKVAKSTAVVKRHELFTTGIVEALAGFKKIFDSGECRETDVNYVCDNALTYGFRAGLTVYKEQKPIDDKGTWTLTGKQNIIELRDALNAAFELAKNIKINADFSITGKKGIEFEFCDRWEGLDISRAFISSVFSITAFYVPLYKGNETIAPYRLVQIAELWACAWVMLSAIRKAKNERDLANIAILTAKINKRFPALKVPQARECKMSITDKNGTTTTAVIDLADDDFDGLYGHEYADGKETEKSYYILMGDIQSIKIEE